ncbi:MAG TPA: thiamine biosynthesis protein ApbE [Algoriphagus sp.]|jgi:thiamine biosynthesis lipoprotein|uniref:FAD:protein FMN transferase n=1 Tax=unclassified Algoriphagus TaxID=2641541 RepID=UPI000C66B2A6|nr:MULTISPECIES: FAD:protein FMN transferase [unclassified Algoriphagus]MAL15402.1 thiamine biosynthesis protein ApbE [Algoriphagus sp.]QYH40350.1 FAD:protein FMN transferase [Algoriphagus sp. NBT04N3]HAD53321.1 thiamine biosynthesis protein ApbE [Algoriphagus sp.]HAS60458.1 thiamine biosynthesis protein ApbE [Algoriphagus sp.]HCB44996.1 thiamine biosynthesis protein ApbE [Algoriphagus sp.]|tara:strand:+ start:2171 stop:3235 length:1065 start_codon:yes stop_codon:yes gene_type:complete
MRPNTRKNIIYSLVLLLLVVVVYTWRNREKSPEITLEEAAQSGKVTLSGQTMGTTYSVTYLDTENRDFKKSIDSLLVVFNQSLSTYISDSELSRFNQGDSLNFQLPFLPQVLKASKEIYQKTEGAFDPTVGPLVNVWGFGPGGPQLKDSVDIQNMLRMVGFDKIDFDSKQLRKKVPGVYLDFSAIAKGQGVDVVAKFLSSKGLSNYLVEIGGELVARGVNEKGELWKVGVNRPEEESNASELYSIIALNNKGMATSGNYRNFYVQDSIKISHTINPKTGYPVRHNLLSATVLANDCMTADAYATAMMVMGTERAIALSEGIKEIEVFLIYSNPDGSYGTYATESLKPYLSFVQE